jgi:hypothetical protein
MWLFQRQEAAARAQAKAEAAKRRSKKKKRWRSRPYNPAYQKRIPVTPEKVDQLVALAQGQVPTPEGEWFYKQFIRFSGGLAKTPEHVRQYLAKAYWLEEDDLRQQIDILLWVLDTKSKVVRDEYWRLATALRIYLIRDEKVFRQDVSHLQAMYQYDIELAQQDEQPEPIKNLDIVFEKNTMFSTFDKYVLYLYHCLGQTEKELAKTLLLGVESASNIKKSLDDKIQESKEKTHGKRNTGRYRSPTFTIFTNR